jgi:hypothetical protein
MKSNFLYTLRTCGTSHEQPEFDLWPGFTKAESNPKFENDTKDFKYESPVAKAVSTKAEESI